MNILRVILIVFLLSSTLKGICQDMDSIKVILSDSGNGGEKYRVFYRGEQKIGVKSTKSGHGYHSFKIKKDKGLYEHSYLPIQVKRKKRFGFCFKISNIDFEYEPDMKYLLIGRDNKLKNSYGFSYIWSNNIRWKYQ